VGHFSSSRVIRTSGISVPKPWATMEDRSRITWLSAIEWGQDWHPRMAAGLSQNRPTSATSDYRHRAGSDSLHAGNRPRELPLRDLNKRSVVTFARFSSTRL